MSTPAMTFVIVTPTYSPDSGGPIVLLELAERLRRKGHSAMIWPANRPRLRSVFDVKVLKTAIDFHLNYRKTFNNGPYATGFAKTRDLGNAVVVYPEIVSGNPLYANKVVRWFLNKPGTFTNEKSFGKSDVFFHYIDAFDDETCANGFSQKLRLTWKPPAYADEGRKRSGVCHMIRKGADHPLAGAAPGLRLDGLSHSEIADVFKSSERFYSYDLYTEYTIFAALCGCIPIVVPRSGVDATQWMPDPRDRVGIAYGDDEIEWATSTRHNLQAVIAERATQEDAQLEQFIRTCRQRFYASEH